MKKTLVGVSLCLSLSAQANTGDIASAAAVAATQSTINTGMMVYWKSQGVPSQIVSLPNGTSYVMPEVPTANSSAGGNAYQNQNNQSNKQAFMSSD